MVPGRPVVPGRPAATGRTSGGNRAHVADPQAYASASAATPPEGVGAPPVTPRRRRRRGRTIAIVAVVVLLALLAWPIGLVVWANGKIQHVDALSGAAATSGTTYLLAGSDSRADGAIEDTETTGARTDTIMLLHVPDSGPTALISLPRDTYVDVAGHGGSKLNSAFSWGGAPLLVQTVEQLTGMTVDHYVEVGFGGIEQVVDAIGGVELCLDNPALTYPVNDADSGLQWDAPGCKVVDGVQALAFSRMRKADPSGDIGRAERQRQLIAALTSQVAEPSLLFKPGEQTSLIDAGTGALSVDDSTDILDLGKLALAFRAANGSGGITGTPPIKNLDYRPGKIGSAVLLDPDTTPAFFAAIRDGSLPAGPVGGMPTS